MEGVDDVDKSASFDVAHPLELPRFGGQFIVFVS
jgi:hypothetical protein